MVGPDGIGYAPNPHISEVPHFRRIALDILHKARQMETAIYNGFSVVADIDPQILGRWTHPQVITNNSGRGIRYVVNTEAIERLLKPLEDSNDPRQQEIAAQIRKDPSQLERAYRHGDIDGFTLVMGDEPTQTSHLPQGDGLQMVTQAGGVIAVKRNQWHDLAGNIGDIFSLMTGWPSTTHRVGYAEGERFAWPFFFHPPKEVGLPLLREEARRRYEEQFVKIYGPEILDQLSVQERASLGKNELQILYDHFLLQRLIDIKVTEPTALDEVRGKLPPRRKSIEHLL